jgi:hypothetical protein
MSFNYATLASSASRLIERFGVLLTFTNETAGAYDPATGQAAKTTTSYQKYGCVFEYSDSERAEETIQEGDRRVLAQPHDYAVGDIVAISGENYRIVTVSQIQPGDTNMAVNLQVRK